MRWCPAGRSAASARRATEAGLIGVDTLGELLAGCEVLLSICRYVTAPYPGPIDIIATRDRAEQIGRAERPWRKRILAGPWTLTKLDCEHGDVFGDYAGLVFDWMKSRMQLAEGPIYTASCGNCTSRGAMKFGQTMSLFDQL